MTTSPTFWKILIATDNGVRIGGRRRAVGDVFPAPEAAVRFLVLDGVLQACTADGTLIAPGTGTGQADFTDPGNSGLSPLV